MKYLVLTVYISTDARIFQESRAFFDTDKCKDAFKVHAIFTVFYLVQKLFKSVFLVNRDKESVGDDGLNPETPDPIFFFINILQEIGVVPYLVPERGTYVLVGEMPDELNGCFVIDHYFSLYKCAVMDNDGTFGPFVQVKIVVRQ